MRRVLLILGFGGVVVRRVPAERPKLVYNQSIYHYLFDNDHPEYGVYNKNSPPIRRVFKDDAVSLSNSCYLKISQSKAELEAFIWKLAQGKMIWRDILMTWKYFNIQLTSLLTIIVILMSTFSKVSNKISQNRRKINVGPVKHRICK